MLGLSADDIATVVPKFIDPPLAILISSNEPYMARDGCQSRCVEVKGFRHEVWKAMPQFDEFEAVVLELVNFSGFGSRGRNQEIVAGLGNFPHYEAVLDPVR